MFVSFENRPPIHAARLRRASPSKRGVMGQRNQNARPFHSHPVVRARRAVHVGSIVAQVGVAISIGPPALPVYEQPLCPGDGYLWTPGYWAYDYDVTDYYWVPGTWVMGPEIGFLWTPAYWGWGGDGFVFYDGYWGPSVGFYGGINYGFGYFGLGFGGGRWDGGHFFYNRSVANVNITVIHNITTQPLSTTTCATSVTTAAMVESARARQRKKRPQHIRDMSRR
jgi:hypothetical protein